MSKIGILQPGYLPWIGFFEQIYQTETFVIYDDVQYDKHGWRNRNRIKTVNGPQWLTVPVSFSLNNPQMVKDIRIDNKTNWKKKHLLSIKSNYSKAEFFKDYFPFFEEIYNKEWIYLVDLNMSIILKILVFLGMSERKIVYSSTLNVSGDRIQRLVEICKFLNATSFYEGAAGKDYMEPAVFKESGIELIFQDYKHPVYNQLFGEFIPYLSIIDLLMNQGNKSLSILNNIK